VRLLTLQEAGETGAVDWKDLSTMKELTCINHQGMKYLTKNPSIRTLHIVTADPEVLKDGKIECDCPFSDLRVVIRDE
jgi:hypothetical protein